MKFFLAPMQGLTGYTVRNAFHHHFDYIDKYYTPFIPAAKRMNAKIKRDIDPINNDGITLIPQAMSIVADEVIDLHRQLVPYGYDEINVNLGISKDCTDYSIEWEKVKMAVDMKAEAIMDLSCYGKTHEFRQKLIDECPAMIGTVPMYDAVGYLDKELAELCDEIGTDVDFDEWERNLQQGEDGKWRYVAGSVGKPMRFAGDGVDKSKKNGIINNRKLSISDRILEWNDEEKILEYSPDEVEAELLKSEICREANEYIVDNNIIINFDYSQFSLFDEELCLGEVISSKDIAIYPNNCKSVSALAKTIIHEVEHLKINSDYNTQKEEVRCKLAEIKHTKNNYDYSDIRRTITEVKKINGYNGMSWR